MISEISSFPFPVLKVDLNQGEEIVCEKGSLVSLQGEFDLRTKTEVKSYKNWILKLFGKSLTYNVFRAKEEGLQIQLAPSSIGELIEVPVEQDHAFYFLPANHLANFGQIQFGMQFLGIKSSFLGDGVVMTKASGSGKIFLIAFGAIMQKQLAEGEKLLVDEGFVVGFSHQIQHRVRSLGLKHTLTSGEGLLIELRGPGQVYLQSRRKPEDNSSGGLGGLLNIFS